MSMLMKFANALALTATAIGTPVEMNESPFLGNPQVGKRTAIMRLSALPGGAAVLEIQGHDAIDEPAEADEGWYTIETLTSASELATEIELSRWMRTNITTLGTGTIDIDLEGIQ